MDLFGRRKIFCDEPITEANIVKVLNDALVIHTTNAAEIEYLHNYYKGKQPILDRVKEIRPEICNKIVINRANEIVSFKDGYLIGEPVQYISRGETDETNDDINALNSYMNIASKASEDMALVNWMHICGVGYRLVLPSGDSESPFNLYTLNPARSFVVYLSDVAETPQMGVTYVVKTDNTIVYTCYTDSAAYTIENDQNLVGDDSFRISQTVPYSSPRVPIVEYIANTERMGVFEPVTSLLDAMNLVESNRTDGVEQFIQALLVFTNTDINSEQYDELRARGAIKIFSSEGKIADVKYIFAELDQQQTQTLLDDMYDAVLDICGVPGRGRENSSTSDTGSAVLLRSGWQGAEGRAKITELMFKRSDQEMLTIVCNILRANTDLDLAVHDIEARFTRHNYEGLTVKSNALVAMLNNSHIDPKDAFTSSGLFIDSEAAYMRGKAYFEKNKATGIGGDPNELIAVEYTEGNTPVAE